MGMGTGTGAALRPGDTHGKLVVELVGEERVGELAEVRLAERADAVDVLQVDVLLQVGAALAVELLPASGRRLGHRHGDRDSVVPSPGPLPRRGGVCWGGLGRSPVPAELGRVSGLDPPARGCSRAIAVPGDRGHPRWVQTGPLIGRDLRQHGRVVGTGGRRDGRGGRGLRVPVTQGQRTWGRGCWGHWGQTLGSWGCRWGRCRRRGRRRCWGSCGHRKRGGKNEEWRNEPHTGRRKNKKKRRIKKKINGGKEEEPDRAAPRRRSGTGRKGPGAREGAPGSAPAPAACGPCPFPSRPHPPPPGPVLSQPHPTPRPLPPVRSQPCPLPPPSRLVPPPSPLLLPHPSPVSILSGPISLLCPSPSPSRLVPSPSPPHLPPVSTSIPSAPTAFPAPLPPRLPPV